MKVIRFNPTSHEVTYLDAKGQQITTIIPVEHRNTSESKVLFSDKFTADIKRKRIVKRASIIIIVMISISLLVISLWAQ